MKTEIHKQRRDFVARGLASNRKAKQRGKYLTADAVLDGMRKYLVTACNQTVKTDKR